jgi:hypothetical protein
MNTFLPYEDFKKTAECLDNKRLGKQRVEAWTIYLTLQKIKEKGRAVAPNCTKPYGDKCGYCYECKRYQETIKIGWENHPAVKMWKGYELALMEYGLEICKEWIKRGFKDNMIGKFLSFTQVIGLICLESFRIGMNSLGGQNQIIYRMFGR